jgi:hypothetical protein
MSTRFADSLAGAIIGLAFAVVSIGLMGLMLKACGVIK